MSPPPEISQPELTAEPELSPSHPHKPNRKGVGAVIGGGLLLVLAKLKFLLVGLKALKFGKILLSMGSMVVMIWYEAMQGGWPFGVGFVLLLLIHELGHGYEIKRAGLAAGYPVFIPFFGALIALKEQPRSPLQEARIAFAGPVWGAAASVAVGGALPGDPRAALPVAGLHGLFPEPVQPDAARLSRRRAGHPGLLAPRLDPGAGDLRGAVHRDPDAAALLIGIMALMNVFQRPAPEPALIAARGAGRGGGPLPGAMRRPGRRDRLLSAVAPQPAEASGRLRLPAAEQLLEHGARAPMQPQDDRLLGRPAGSPSILPPNLASRPTFTSFSAAAPAPPATSAARPYSAILSVLPSKSA